MIQNMFKHSLIRKSSCVSNESCFELNVSSSYRAAGTQPHGGAKAFPCVQLKVLFAQSLLRAP